MPLNLVGLNAANQRRPDKSFEGCNHSGAPFTEAALDRAVFTGASLHKASFNGARLTGAVFTRTRIESATFLGAPLGGISQG